MCTGKIEEPRPSIHRSIRSYDFPRAPCHRAQESQLDWHRREVSGEDTTTSAGSIRRPRPKKVRPPRSRDSADGHNALPVRDGRGSVRQLAAAQLRRPKAGGRVQSAGVPLQLAAHGPGLRDPPPLPQQRPAIAAVQIRYLCRGVADAGAADDAEAEEYHSKLEQLLELSAGMTVMMFLVLEFVALESLLRNTRQGQAVKRGQTFLGVALLVSFMASTLGVSLMNVWTTPHVISGCVVLTAEFMRVLNFSFHALPIAAVVVLITLDVLPHAWKLAVWLPFFPLVIVLLVLLARYSREAMKQQEPAARGRGKQGPEATGSSTASDPSSSGEKKPDDPKPASLELTKVAFTGFLAVAVPSVTSASFCVPSAFFVLFSAATVLLGLLWRLLTHEAEPPSCVLQAANHASFSAHMSIFLAGIAFWVMAAFALH